jgi:hypothetical protein
MQKGGIWAVNPPPGAAEEGDNVLATERTEYTEKIMILRVLCALSG